MGFSFNAKYGNSDNSVSLVVGSRGVVVMLFSEPVFKKFTGNEIADTQKSTEVLFFIDAGSR